MWFSLTKGILSYIFWRKWSFLGQREQFQWYSCMWWRCSQSCCVYSRLLLLKHIGRNENNENDIKNIKVVHERGQDSCCHWDQLWAPEAVLCAHCAHGYFFVLLKFERVTPRILLHVMTMLTIPMREKRQWNEQTHKSNKHKVFSQTIYLI